jgi:2'-5' RNA ligase
VSETVRAFIAVPLPDSLRDALAEARAELQREAWAEGVSWVKAGNFHLTLRFLGETPVDTIPLLAQKVGEAVSTLVPFTAEVEEIDVFPSHRRPRAIAAQVEGGAPLQALAGAVEAGVVAAGLPPASRAFSKAHITLGRIRRRTHGRPIVDLEQRAIPLPVDSAVLYRSELRPTGAVYSVLERLLLAGTSR